MREYIGDEVGKSPIHRLFTKGEEDIALEYLIQSHKDGFKIVGISAEDGEMGFMPEEFIDTIYKSFMASMYGINLPTIANMWKVQTTFMDKYLPLLMDYLQYTNANVEYYEFVPNSIAIPYMSNFAESGFFIPQARWDPDIEWRKMYVDDKKANIISPFNIFVNAKLIFSNPPKEFLKAAIPNDEQREEMKRFASEKKSSIKIVYSLLPNDNFNKILNIIDMVHRYF